MRSPLGSKGALLGDFGVGLCTPLTGPARASARQMRLHNPVFDFDFTRATLVDQMRGVPASFTRSGAVATRINPLGLRETIGSNVPCFNYDPSTLQCLGIELQLLRTNQWTEANNFTAAIWTKVNATLTQNRPGTDGGTTAWSMVEDALAGVGPRITQSAPYTSGTSAAVAVSAKELPGSAKRYLAIVFVNTAFGSALLAVFDLATGTVTFTTSASVVAEVEVDPSGFFRCKARCVATVTATTPSVQIRVTNSSSNITAYTGDGVSGIVIADAMHETGSFWTSHIPTGAATVTRTNDELYVNNLTGMLASEGCVIAEFMALSNGLTAAGASDFPIAWELDSSAVSNSNHTLLMSSAYGPGVQFSSSVAGASQCAIQKAMTLGVRTVRRIGFAWKANDFSVCMDGSPVIPANKDSAGNVAAVLDRLSMGMQNGAGGSNQGRIILRRIRGFNVKPVDTQLETLCKV